MRFGIHAKIFVLLASAIGLLTALGAGNIWLDVYKDRRIEVVNQSQSIALQMAEDMRLQQEFIAFPDAEMLPALQTSRTAVNDLLVRMQLTVQTATIRQLLTTVMETHTARSELFDRIRQNITAIAEELQEFDTTLNEITIAVIEIIGAIEKADAEALVSGTSLSQNEESLRNLMNELLSTLNQRNVAIQFAYGRLEFEPFYEIRETLGELDFIESLVMMIDVEAYSAPWERVMTKWLRLAEIEDAIVKNVQDNQTLKVELRQNGKQIQDVLSQIRGYAQDQIAAITQFSYLTTLAIFFAGIVIMLVIGVPVNRSVRKSLQILTAELYKLLEGEGDLTKRLEIVSRDELGTLAEMFNQFLEQLQSMVTQIQRSGLQVTSSSTELSAMSKQHQATIMVQAESIARASDSIQEIARVASRLVETMHQVSTLSQGTATFASQGVDDLHQMQSAMQRMEVASQSISGKLTTISEKAETITPVITTITKVAEQTNLLSLNASIEAEKAGEYGRGFTVVAREIRRLADQTAVAVLNIERLVNGMQSAVSAGVMEMDKFMAEVKENAADVEKVSGRLGRIIEHVQTLLPQFEEVKEAMEGQSVQAHDIYAMMTQLTDEIQQTTDSLRESFSAIEQLDEAARGLQGEVTRFTVM